MKTITATIKMVKVLTVCYGLLWVANKAPKATQTSIGYAQEIANTQGACASHTAAVNEVIDWAAK